MERNIKLNFILPNELTEARVCLGCDNKCFGGEGQPIGVRVIKEAGPIKTALLYYKEEESCSLTNGCHVDSGSTGKEVVFKRMIMCPNDFF